MDINRMLSLNLLIIFYLVPNSLTDRCPSTNSCVCSPDLTTVACTSQRLTDDFFLNLDIQFPQSTVVLNLSSNFFSSISALSNLDNLQTLDLSSNRLQSLPANLFTKFPQLSALYLQDNSIKTIPRTFNEVSNINLDLSNNPLNCTCQLKWILKWFETINLRGPINCNEKDFCSSKKSFLHITPEQSQIVYENDSFALNCSSNSKTFWTLNNEMYSSNAEILIPHLQPNHSGLWTCHSATHNRSVSLHVLNLQSNHFCPSIQMDTSKGYFYWPRTLTGQSIQLRCPFGPAAWFARYAQASYACSRNRQWVDLDLSQCAFRTNISREFDRILSHNQSNLLSKLVTFMSKADASELQFDDIIFLIDLIDEEQSKYISSKKNIEEIAMLVYRLTDFILQVKQDFIIIKEYQAALNRLRTILEQLLAFTDHSWIYVGKQLTAMTLESPLPPTVCFIPDRPLLTIICGIVNRHFKRHESNLATIQFPSRSNATGNQSSTFKIIFFRQATLFTPNVKSSSNAVIYMKPVVARNASIVKLTFYGESSQASIGTWSAKQTSWQIDPPMCTVTQRTIDLLSADCIFTKDTPLSITFRTRYEETRSLFLNANYLELAIYVSSIIASACFGVCILFYVCCHKVYLMPRSFFHCLINYWLSLAILFPLFAFGIRQTHYLFLCQFFAISLHYLCLTTILWLTLLAYCIWQKLYDIWSGKGHGEDADGNPGKSSVTIVDYDDDGLPIMKLKTKPIIQFYLLAYGISFIICGINVAISREQYITNKICFLNNFESLLTLFIPIIIFVFLLLTFLLAARLNIKRLTQEAIRLRNSPDETEVDPETNVESDDLNLSTKPNETVPIIIPSNHPNPEQALPHMDCRQSHLDSLCSSDMDHQHQPANQLLSILFQLFLLICIFLASLSIYIHPLQSFHIRFEHSLYNHLYGVFVLLLAFYVLAFYVLTRSDLTMHCQYYACCSSRTKKRLLNQSYSEPPPPPQTPQLSPAHPLMPLSKELDDERTILHQHLNPDDSFTEQIPAPSPPHSHYSTSIYQNQLPQNGETASMTNGTTFGSKHQTTVASKYYARHRHVLKTSISASETSLQQNELIAPSTLNTIRQESPTFLDTEQVHPRSPYAPSPKKPLYSPKDGHIFQNGNPHLHLPTLVSPRIFLRPSTLNISPRLQVSPSQAIIRPLPIVRLSSPSLDKTYPTPSPLVNTNGYASPHIESTPGRSSYRIMPSPSTEERQATYVYLNKNSHLIQQDSSPKEKPSVWKKPVNGHHHHHPHVAFIDEDEEGSVSLKSSTCDSPTATSSSTTSPVVSRKDRSRTISSSSSSSSTYSNGYPTGAVDNEQIVLHESSV